MRLSWLLLLVLGACGSSSIGNDRIDGGTGAGDGPRPVFDARESCMRQSECGEARICNPTTMKCVGSLSCSTHLECGGESYCNSGACAPNVVRGVCDDDVNCLGPERCEAGRCGCGGELLTATAIAPNMLIALDRSQSMDGLVPRSGNPLRSRWTIAIVALKAITASYAGGIRFGLTLWPGANLACSGGEQCQGVHHAQPLGSSSAMIGASLDAAGRCGLSTPIASAGRSTGGVILVRGHLAAS